MRFAKLFFAVITLTGTIANLSYAQEKENYYLFPIKPGETNSLSGTMGELRSNHFHAGLDIRTEGRIGLPVYAAADGYISRIAVSTGGYGNAVYLQHPNGTTTVYAHLDRFVDPHASFIRELQYRQRTFDVNLYFDAGDFPVKKGDQIAYSGNSGSSGGPHVHFDLRDEKQDLLNPLSYGFAEIKDTTPPVAISLGVKTLNKDSRVNGHFGRFDFNISQSGNKFSVAEPIYACGEIGLDLYAYDLLDNARFRCGIKEIAVFVADKVTFRQDISTFAFSEQRNILVHMDYQALRSTGQRSHKLYVDDGNYMKFYKTDREKGKLKIEEGRDYPVKVVMKDPYGNESTLSFTIHGGEPDNPPVKESLSHGEFSLVDNTLVIGVKYPNAEMPTEVGLSASAERLLAPSYVTGGTSAAYLWDMRVAIPHVIRIGEEIFEMPYKMSVTPSAGGTYKDKFMELSFTRNDVFDTLYLTTAYRLDSVAKKEYFSFGDPNVPMRDRIAVSLIPQIEYSHPDKLAVFSVDEKNNTSYSGGEWNGNSLSFRTRDFGTYTIQEDLDKPEITALTLNQNSLRFRISDKKTGVKEYSCYVNGEWILMNYDYKRDLIWSEKRDDSIKFTGEVKLVVRDNVNNETVFTTKIN